MVAQTAWGPASTPGIRAERPIRRDSVGYALRQHGIERAVFHWHKAPDEVTREIVAAGYYVSVTPEVVYRQRDREMVEWLPLESLLVETDSPWPYKNEFSGLKTEPWMASRVAEEVAKLKRLPVDEVMFRLAENTCSLFDLDLA